MRHPCGKTVREAVGEAFSDDEIDDILERLARRKHKVRQDDPLLSDAEAMEAAARDLTREEVLGGLIERRMQAAAARAQKARRARLELLPGDEADKLRAYNVGTEKQGPFANASVDAEGRARTVALWGMIEKGLSAHPGLAQRLVSNFMGRQDDGFARDVAREMWRLNGGEGVEPTGNAEAAAAAEVFARALEAGRGMQNREGAFIGRIKGYMGRQSHDRLKVAGGFWRELGQVGRRGVGLDFKAARRAAAGRAFREWRDTIRPLLDPETFKGIDEADLDPAGLVSLDTDAEFQAAFARHRSAKARTALARSLRDAGVIDSAEVEEAFLYRVWSDIVSGRHEVLEGASDLGDFRPPPGKARAASRSRVLHFRGPDAWMDYAAAYGPQGGLYGSIMRDLQRAAQNSALMARWGPSPEAAFTNEVERLAAQARDRGDVEAARGLSVSMRRAEFEELTGASSAPDHLRLAIIGRSIRVWESLTKLGGVVLSAMGDTALTAQTFQRAGGTYLDGYSAAFKGIARMQDEDGRAVADALDVGARSAAAHLAGRFAASDGFTGWAGWAQRAFYKVNLFEAWVDGLRRGAAEGLSAIWGRQAALDWDALNAGTRETFERYGLDAGSWDLLRAGAVTLDDGRAYLTGEAVDGADADGLLAWAGFAAREGADAAEEAAAIREAALTAAREDLRVRFQTLASGLLDDALTEARARERVGLTRGARAGTVHGEFLRTFTQFWSFSQAVVGRHLAPAARGYGGKHPVALMAHLILATTAMGYVSLQAKEIVKGRKPRPMVDGEGEFTGGKVFLAALLQGGGLGLYGDFLFGEANRMGLSSLTAFGGPAIGDAERLYQILNKLAYGSAESRDDVPGDLLRWGATMTPFLNVWYTKLALDYAVLWRMQEATSPGYLERYERRLEDSQGTEFWLSPSEAAG